MRPSSYLSLYEVKLNRYTPESKSITSIPLLSNCIPTITSNFRPFSLRGAEVKSAD